MKLGTKIISRIQRSYLNEAQKAQEAESVFEYLHEVLSDKHILREQEEVHPEWISLFNKFQGKIKQNVTDNTFKKLYDQIAELTEPIDSQIREVDPSNTAISFLLGAGASKPAPSNIPTVQELLPDLLARARRLDREDLTKLADFCEAKDIQNIEDLLTAANLATFCSRTSNVFQLLDFLLYRGQETENIRLRQRLAGARGISSVAFLQDTLQVLFGLLTNRMLTAKPNSGHGAIADYAKNHPKSQIVTTNYDCCIDLALGEPGKDFSYGMEFGNVEADLASRGSVSQLIKLHGSVNCFYCDTCQDVQLTDTKRAVSEYLSDKTPYPVIAICRHCGGQRRPLLVPPLAMKFDVPTPLTPLLQDARRAFEGAELIVVVGFSFAEADSYISRIISKSMTISPKKKLVIIDPDHTIVEKVRRRFETSIPDFDRKRIVRIKEDCAKALPAFLGGKLLKKEPVDRIDVRQMVPEEVPGPSQIN